MAGGCVDTFVAERLLSLANVARGQLGTDEAAEIGWRKLDVGAGVDEQTLSWAEEAARVVNAGLGEDSCSQILPAAIKCSGASQGAAARAKFFSQGIEEWTSVVHFSRAETDAGEGTEGNEG